MVSKTVTYPSMFSQLSGDSITVAQVLTLVGLAVMFFFGVYVALRCEK